MKAGKVGDEIVMSGQLHPRPTDLANGRVPHSFAFAAKGGEFSQSPISDCKLQI